LSDLGSIRGQRGASDGLCSKITGDEGVQR
jgi:hypothetical protein